MGRGRPPLKHQRSPAAVSCCSPAPQYPRGARPRLRHLPHVTRRRVPPPWLVRQVAGAHRQPACVQIACRMQLPLCPQSEHEPGNSFACQLTSFYTLTFMANLVYLPRLHCLSRASVCLAIEKTAGIITAAGLIMSIRFQSVPCILRSRYLFVYQQRLMTLFLSRLLLDCCSYDLVPVSFASQVWQHLIAADFVGQY